MGQSLGTDGLMMRIAKFIVNKRKAFLALFALACVYSVISIPKVEVIEDVTEYLPKTTETRRGLDTMEEEFTTFGSGKILVANITYEQALRVAEEMEQIEGVSQVQFYDESDDAYEDEELEDYYKDASALFSITFTDEEDAEVTQRAIVKVRELVSGYSSYVYTTVDKDDAASLQKDMGVILAFASIVIVSVLLFTSLTYMEIVIFVLVFGVSALLNMGTNYLMGSISFVTNAVGTVLQLAMAIDYAIILFHRFMEEREHYEAEQGHSGDFLQQSDHDLGHGGAHVHAVRHRHGSGAGDDEGHHFQSDHRVPADAGAGDDVQQGHRPHEAQEFRAEDQPLGKADGEDPFCHDPAHRGRGRVRLYLVGKMPVCLRPQLHQFPEKE